MGYLLRYQSEFTELAKSRFLDCDSCGMTQGALIRNVADCQALYMQAKQPRSDRLYMTTLDTGRCSHILLGSSPGMGILTGLTESAAHKSRALAPVVLHMDFDTDHKLVPAMSPTWAPKVCKTVGPLGCPWWLWAVVLHAFGVQVGPSFLWPYSPEYGRWLAWHPT